jgi:hypothetical protein
MSNGDKKPSELVPPQTFGYDPGQSLKPGGDFEQTQRSMWGGVTTAEDTATAATEAGPRVKGAAAAQASAIGQAAGQQGDVIKAAHKNALVLARQAMAERAMQGMRRGRSTAGNIQAAGGLGKEAAATYSGMASQQAREVGDVEYAAQLKMAELEAQAEEKAAGLDVIAAQAWEEANLAMQTYFSGTSEMSDMAENAFQVDLAADLTNVLNANQSPGTIGGFNESWNQATLIVSEFDPTISQHLVGAQAIIMEMMGQAPPELNVPTAALSYYMPALFEVYGLQDTMAQLGELVHYFAEGPQAVDPITGETTSVPPMKETWSMVLNYMVQTGASVQEIMQMDWNWDSETNAFSFTPGA